MFAEAVLGVSLHERRLAHRGVAHHQHFEQVIAATHGRRAGLVKEAAGLGGRNGEGVACFNPFHSGPLQTEVRHCSPPPAGAVLTRKQKGKLCTQHLRASSPRGRSLGGAQGASSEPPGCCTFSPTQPRCRETGRDAAVPRPPGLPRSGARGRLNPGQLISHSGSDGGGFPAGHKPNSGERAAHTWIPRIPDRPGLRGPRSSARVTCGAAWRTTFSSLPRGEET